MPPAFRLLAQRRRMQPDRVRVSGGILQTAGLAWFKTGVQLTADQTFNMAAFGIRFDVGLRLSAAACKFGRLPAAARR